MKNQKEPILNIKDLQISFPGPHGEARVLEGVSFSLYPGEILSLVGETGCGKSVTASGILNLVPKYSHLYRGTVEFENTNLLTLSNKEMSTYRGHRINMIFQNPQASINPVFTIGEQVSRLVRMYLPQEIKRRQQEDRIRRKEAIRRIVKKKLARVGLSDIDQLLKKHAHQISGGMAQRIKIAMALLGSPDILIADEATSALDVTVQAHILKLMRDLCREENTAILFITHDLGIAAQICDRVAVMYSGRIVEIATTEELFLNPKHPYTKGLLKSVPKLGQKENLVMIPGMIPDLTHPPVGCRFHPRCGEKMDRCGQERPEKIEIGENHHVACHLFPQERHD